MERTTKRVARVAMLVSALVATISMTHDLVLQWSRVHRGNHDDPIANVIEGMKDEFPHVDQLADASAWADDIRQAFREAGVEMNEENLAVALTLMQCSSGLRAVPRAYDRLWGPSEKFFCRFGIKPKTSGPLETSVGYVMDEEGVDYGTALRLLGHRTTGLRLGMAHLRKLMEIYATVGDAKLRRACIFADHNAGDYASWNAGLQQRLNAVTGSALSPDGVLLRRGDKPERSATEAVIKHVLDQHRVPLTADDIRADLSLASSGGFRRSETYARLHEILGDIPPVPACKPVRGLAGFAKRLLTGVGDSRDYAERREEEHERVWKILRSVIGGPCRISCRRCRYSNAFQWLNRSRHASPKGSTSHTSYVYCRRSGKPINTLMRPRP